MRTRTTLILAILLIAVAAHAHNDSGYVTVLVDDAARPEYFHDGTTYIEAVRGASYALRITNPTPYRVAVALSVDGLNTIDARHTAARDAAKWVLEPHQSTVISGWQVSDRAARSFFFTGERHSYGARLGRTDNLGVIEAVFFREYGPIYVEPSQIAPSPPLPPGAADGAVGSAAPSMKTQRESTSDDYAATGMGRRERHEVESVDIRLDPDPVASIRIRYEFTPQLVKLGILPQAISPLERRERARGFSDYCPER
jgi:hypothetical protein